MAALSHFGLSVGPLIQGEWDKHGIKLVHITYPFLDDDTTIRRAFLEFDIFKVLQSMMNIPGTSIKIGILLF